MGGGGGLKIQSHVRSQIIYVTATVENLGKYCFQLLKCICLWLYRILRRKTQKWEMIHVPCVWFPFLLPGPSDRTTKLNYFSLSTSHHCRQMQASQELPQTFFLFKNQRQRNFTKLLDNWLVLRNKNPLFPQRADDRKKTKKQKSTSENEDLNLSPQCNLLLTKPLPSSRSLPFPSNGAGEHLSHQTRSERKKQSFNFCHLFWNKNEKMWFVCAAVMLWVKWWSTTADETMDTSPSASLAVWGTLVFMVVRE